MNDSYSKWSDVRATGRAADPRTSAEQAVGKAVAKERQEAYIRGHQLTEMRLWWLWCNRCCGTDDVRGRGSVRSAKRGIPDAPR